MAEKGEGGVEANLKMKNPEPSGDGEAAANLSDQNQQQQQQKKTKLTDVLEEKGICMEPPSDYNAVYGSMGGIHFQEEILMDILSRLPLRPLYRFKCVSKFWNTLIFSPSFKMKIELSAVEKDICTNIVALYLFQLFKGLFKGRDPDWKEFMDNHPLTQNLKELLGYDHGRVVHPPDDDNSEDDYSEDDYSEDEEDDWEEVDDVDTSDGSDDGDDGEKGELPAQESPNREDNFLYDMLHLVPQFEVYYKDRKSDLKEIQDKYLPSGHVRELLGHNSGSDMRPSEDANTKDERAAAEELDIEKVDDAESRGH